MGNVILFSLHSICLINSDLENCAFVMTNVTLGQLKEALKKQKDELLDEHFKRHEEALKSQRDDLLVNFSRQQEELKNELLSHFSKQQEEWRVQLESVRTSPIKMLAKLLVLRALLSHWWQ